MHDFPDCYTAVNVYDPSMPNSCRQLIVERYIQGGKDVTQEVIAQHTKLLMECQAYATALATINERMDNLTSSFERALLERKAVAAGSFLDSLENKWTGLRNYRSYRTPFK